ncbi:hypothetical protein GH714_036616 [Hevea brasiliensis]|uniref:WRC domain-containing protein n=1 Tax=Hevea brasiliensis TaxID=3981 RepID=A0A6A6KKM9_HEVBR|nr:hypothetical protein GH714_036616 [Hevea brasiliensis]
MRIRKRKVPFPLSSLSPVPLSDPHLSRSSSDQLQLLRSNPHQNFSSQDAKASYFTSQSSDQPNYPIGGPPNAQDCSDGSWKQEDKKVLMQDEEVKGGEGEKSNDTSEELEEDGDEETKGDDHRTSSSVKKRVRGGALSEGSRCSRVNGRGWRCCQQTLVGYSLCEHHLGKGRLRSMTSVRSRSMAETATNKGESQPLSSPPMPLAGEETKGISLDDKVIGAVHEDEEVIKKPLITTKKKQKLGMVKARSISSLLGQSNNAIELSENDE